MYLNHDPSPPEKFLHLIRHERIRQLSALAIRPPSLLILLAFQMRHGSVYAADLSVRPTPDSMPSAQALKRSDRDVHRLEWSAMKLFERQKKKRE